MSILARLAALEAAVSSLHDPSTGVATKADVDAVASASNAAYEGIGSRVSAIEAEIGEEPNPQPQG